ncbi:MAG TPA: hypothetical protein VE954_10060 [Oligoflexus sp.]|uniref:hypothetical protein n=1 Tax=Oligoflexus sp. TaxID=1971216 RepID=UPI002D54EC72|nr:hypothetical protein [Oligoflexus sp.]HYX33446.1 hypothetical protein [Oligoflexus sp.]
MCKEALAPFSAVQVTMEKHVRQVEALVEKIGTLFIMGEAPVIGASGRLRHTAAALAGTELNKVGKPADEMSVLNVLRVDHRKAQTLFQEIEQADDPLSRHDLFYQLRVDLLSHIVQAKARIQAHLSPHMTSILVGQTMSSDGLISIAP